MNPLLTITLGKLEHHYLHHAVEEIAINRPFEIWIKPSGKNWISKKDDSLSESYFLKLCQILANSGGQNFHPETSPLLYTTLPEGHRFTAIVGHSVRYDLSDVKGIALTIRMFDPLRRISLDRYGLLPGQSLTTMPLRHGKKRYALSPFEDLIEAIRHREAILISGATSTGKTSFLNTMISYLPMDCRILTVEDSREIMIPHPNRVHLLVSRTHSSHMIDFMKIVDVIVRLTPDVIICGEISITNASGIFRLMTTGHTNFMATIHAHSPEAAIKAFYQNLLYSNPGIDSQSVQDIIRSSFGRIVQIDRQGFQRIVTEIEIPNLIDTVLGEASL
jgi:type IV secretion system protein VirB11